MVASNCCNALCINRLHFIKNLFKPVKNKFFNLKFATFFFFFHPLLLCIYSFVKKQTDMKPRRKFYNGVINHVYQRTVGGVHLFYSIDDCLVFLSILSVCARSSKVQILEACLMHNHIHILILVESSDELCSFMQRMTSWFVRLYNREHGRKGHLLKKNFGSAPKWDEKKQRSASIYIGNNPVEKNFCQNAEEYRWNFLAYARSNNPFSDPISAGKSSFSLKKCSKIVDGLISQNLPLRYSIISHFKKKLNAKEFEQLVDHIIVGYYPFDNNRLISLFKSYDDMITAMHSTTGGEYDIKEDRDDFSITSFKAMMKYLRSKYSDDFITKMISLPIEEKFKLASELTYNTCASNHQICKFLHIPMLKK